MPQSKISCEAQLNLHILNMTFLKNIRGEFERAYASSSTMNLLVLQESLSQRLTF